MLCPGVRSTENKGQVKEVKVACKRTCLFVEISVCGVSYFLSYLCFKWLKIAFFLLLLLHLSSFPKMYVCFLQWLFFILSTVSAVGCESTWQTVLNNNVKVWLLQPRRTQTVQLEKEKQTSVGFWTCIDASQAAIAKTFLQATTKTRSREGGKRCIFFIEQLCGCVYNLKGNKAYCVADCSLLWRNWRWGEWGRCELRLLNSDY